MITGINANIKHDGITYHIQTEDGGRESPIITTLLFKEGAICSSKKTNYTELLQTDSFEGTVKRLMETQHREMIQELCGGEVKQAGPEEAASSPSPPAHVETQKQVESGPSTESVPLQPKQGLEHERKGLDALIQDYLADKQTGRDD